MGFVFGEGSLMVHIKVPLKRASLMRFDTVQALKKSSFNPVSKIFVFHDLHYYVVLNLTEI